MKVTGIELLQKIKDNEFSIYQKATSLDSTYRDCTIGFILDTSNLDEIMNLEFEIQTTEKGEETKEIEELNEEDKKILNNLINKKQDILEFQEIKAIVKLLLEINKKTEKLMPIELHIENKESEEK